MQVLQELLLILNQPPVLAALCGASVLLVLLDYLLPVDWLAYLGYAAFALFVGTTLSVSPSASVIVMVTVAVGMLVLHKAVFARFLTNAPRIESAPGPES